MINSAIRERFVRDDLAHRLGALAANLLRVETFCKRSGSLELARRVMEESKVFVEWSAKNAPIEVAAELVQLQRELSLRLRGWPINSLDPVIESEIAPWAARWADRVLQMSGLSTARHVPKNYSIPAGHKFTVIALGGVWHRIETVETDIGVYTRSGPVAPDHYWTKRMGTGWVERVRDAEVFLVTTTESANGNLDREMFELALRCDLMRYGLALTSRHFKCGKGVLLSGYNHAGEMRIRQTGEIPSLSRHPESKTVQLTEPDFLRAGEFAERLFEPFMTTNHRLKLTVESFMDGMQSREAVQRIHHFVRCIEGIIRPRKSRTQRDFVHSVQSILTANKRGKLEEMFRIRSADEHLNDPMEEIPGEESGAKDNILFRRAAEAEAIARTFLTRVLETPALQTRRFEEDSAASTHWSEVDRRLWGMPLDLDLEVRDMTSYR